MGDIKTGNRDKPAGRQRPGQGLNDRKPFQRRGQRLPPGPAIFIMAGVAALLWGLLLLAVHVLRPWVF
jgi:hypothetical protein